MRASITESTTGRGQDPAEQGHCWQLGKCKEKWARERSSLEVNTGSGDAAQGQHELMNAERNASWPGKSR